MTQRMQQRNIERESWLLPSPIREESYTTFEEINEVRSPSTSSTGIQAAIEQVAQWIAS